MCFIQGVFLLAVDLFEGVSSQLVLFFRGAFPQTRFQIRFAHGAFHFPVGELSAPPGSSLIASRATLLSVGNVREACHLSFPEVCVGVGRGVVEVGVGVGEGGGGGAGIYVASLGQGCC